MTNEFASQSFVGREPEMRVLQEGVDDALAGRGRFLLLSGEPGIGKTRTAEELAAHAKRSGSNVVWGRCYEGEGAPAFWPWVQILRAAIKGRDDDALRTALGLGGADIAAIVPETRERLPDLPPAVEMDSTEARFRLFDSVAHFLGQLAHETPLVIILDDLQGADEPSLRLLQFVVRALHDVPALLLGTFRDVALTREHRLTTTLAEVLREPRTQQLALSGLSEAEVGRFIELTAGVPHAPTLTATVHERTGGNPLFVTEFVRLLIAEGVLDKRAGATRVPTTIPDGVRAVIHHRLAALPVECSAMLSAASIVGRQFRFDVLEAVLGTPPAALLSSLQKAIRARVLVEVSGAVPRYRFTHALIRETLYDELGAACRIALHRQVGEAIERRTGADEHLAELAYHFFEAGRDGDNDKAVTYAHRAGDRALALLAYEEAVRLYDAGLQALDRRSGGASSTTLKTGPGRPADETRRYELLMARGRAQRATDVAGAKQTFRQAVEVARKIGAPEALGRAVLGIADWLPLEAADAAVVHLLEEAIEAVGPEDSPLRVRLLGRLATELCLLDMRERRATLARQATETARRLADPATLAYALLALHVADCGPENATQRLAVATEMVQAAERAGDNQLIAQGRMCRIVDFLELGDGPAVDHEIETFTQLAAALRQPRYLAWSAHFHAVRALYQGRFDDSERWAFEMAAEAQRGQELAADSLFASEMFTLRTVQGRLDEFEGALKALTAELDSHGNIVAVRCGLARLYSELGRTAEAKSEFEHFAANQFASLPSDALWLNAVACLVRACTFLGDVERAAWLYELLRPYDGRTVTVGHPGTSYDGPVAHYLGVLAATLSSWESAARHFEDGLEMNGRLGARPFVAFTQYDYAATLFAAADRVSGCADESSRWVPDTTRARALLNQALATAQELGMKSLVAKAQRLHDDCVRDVEVAVAVNVQEGEPAHIRSAPPAASSLSDLAAPSDQRERSIEKTPAAGPSNRQPRPEGLFRKEADYWTVAYGGIVLRLKDSKGLQYLDRLLRYPGRELLALDLVMQSGAEPSQMVSGADVEVLQPETGDPGPLLDARAKAAYKHRLDDLRDDLEEAEQHNDLGRAARAREEMTIISRQLAAAIGLGGRHRHGPSQAERARQTVTKGIKSAIAKIRAGNPALARHLAATIATGYFCVYGLEPDVTISWLF